MRFPIFAPIFLAFVIGGGALAYLAGGFSGASAGALLSSVFAGEQASSTGAVVASSTISGTHVTGDVIGTKAPPPDGYVTYKSAKYGFSFSHAPDGKIVEYDEGGGAETIVLENLDRVRGFQVFIVPYTGATISEQRFREDVPSGVRTNVENTTLGGVPAVTFTSKDEILGDTREIWAIHNGYLYEITTFAGVGNWFTPIIQSWEFF